MRGDKSYAGIRDVFFWRRRKKKERKSEAEPACRTKDLIYFEVKAALCVRSLSKYQLMWGESEKRFQIWKGQVADNRNRVIIFNSPTLLVRGFNYFLQPLRLSPSLSRVRFVLIFNSIIKCKCWHSSKKSLTFAAARLTADWYLTFHTRLRGFPNRSLLKILKGISNT